MNSISVRDLFKAHVRAMGKTISEVAREMGIGNQGLRHWLDGKTKIPTSNLRQIAEYIDMTVEELLEEINHEKLCD